MKKIGIMTLYKNNINYGGMLQSYALQRAVQKLVGESGECVQISYTISPTPIKEKLKHSLQYRSFRENASMVYNRLKAIFNKRKTTWDSTARINAFGQFEKIIPHTEKIYTYKTIDECAEEFTHLITGSDQVWNGGIDLDAFCLGFAKKDTKKISYAASNASTKFGKWQDEIFQKNLPGFTAISVREKSVIPYFEQMSGKKVSAVLDPVFLLSAADWHEIAQEPHIRIPYIFCYLLGSNKEQHERAVKIAKENSCKLVTIPYAPITKKNTEGSPPNGKNPRCFLFSESAIFPWGLFPRRRTAPHSSVLFSIPAFHPVPYGRLDMLLSSAKAV